MLQVLPILLYKSALVIFIISPRALYPITLPALGLQIPLPTFLQQCRKNNQGATLGISSK